MGSKSYSDDKVAEASKKLVCINIDPRKGAKEQELSKKYGVKYVPDVRLLDPDGKEIEKLAQASNPSWLAGKLEATAKKFEKKPDDKKEDKKDDKKEDAK